MAALLRVGAIPPGESLTELQNGHAPVLPWDNLDGGTDEP